MMGAIPPGGSEGFEPGKSCGRIWRDLSVAGACTGDCTGDCTGSGATCPWREPAPFLPAQIAPVENDFLSGSNRGTSLHYHLLKRGGADAAAHPTRCRRSQRPLTSLNGMPASSQPLTPCWFEGGRGAADEPATKARLELAAQGLEFRV